MLYILFKRYAGSSMSMSSVIWFVVITWSLFPVIWVLAPTGIGFCTTDIEAILYLALDFITKITFGGCILQLESALLSNRIIPIFFLFPVAPNFL
ncbi:bacteriorhodopsin [Thermoproteota archaeon]